LKKTKLALATFSVCAVLIFVKYDTTSFSALPLILKFQGEKDKTAFRKDHKSNRCLSADTEFFSEGCFSARMAADLPKAC